ncbi:MAG TPA: hypothetical protein VFC75_03685 [Erysipelothrix sp.]|nr:hypothetical protein [Erysipelothrix sp.]
MNKIKKIITLGLVILHLTGCTKEPIRLDGEYNKIKFIDTANTETVVKKSAEGWIEDSYYFNAEVFDIFMEEILSRSFISAKDNPDKEYLYSLDLEEKDASRTHLNIYDLDFSTNKVLVEIDNKFYETSSLFLKIFKPQMLHHYYLFIENEAIDEIKVYDTLKEKTWTYQYKLKEDQINYMFDAWVLSDYFNVDYPLETDRQAWFMYEMSRLSAIETDVNDFKEDFKVEISAATPHTFSVMIEKESMILKYEDTYYASESVSLQNALVNPINLVYRFPFLESIDAIETISYKDKKGLVEIDVLQQLINDQEIDSEELANVYQHLLTIYGEDKVDIDNQVFKDEEAEIVVNYEMKDGNHKTIALYPHEKDYIIVLNDVSDFKMQKENLKDLTKLMKTYNR